MAMHRISAGLLIALFGFSLVSPAVFASGGDSNLPACCRRAGKHHCSIQSSSMPGADSPAGPSLRSLPCPLFPTVPNFPANRVVTGLGSRPPILFGLIGQPAHSVGLASIARASYSRPGEKRGPPSPLG